MKIFRTVTFALAAAAGLSQAALAGPLEDVSNYFNDLSTLETGFTQYNADGTVSTGTFYLRRPGRLRMEYDANSNGALLVVGGSTVAIFDKKSDAQPTQYPLKRTPLGPILARTVNLTSEKMIDGVDAHDDGLSVFASDPDHPEYGVGRFGFAKEPLQLESWTMTNEMGETTHIVFDQDAKVGGDLSSFLFSIPYEQSKRSRDR